MLESASQTQDNAAGPTSHGHKITQSHNGATIPCNVSGGSTKPAGNGQEIESFGGSATLGCAHGDTQPKLAGNSIHTTVTQVSSADQHDTKLLQGLSKDIRCAHESSGDGQIWRKAKKQLVSA